MAGYENFLEDSAQIEKEILRRGVVLNIDRSDEVQLHALASEALDHLNEAARIPVREPVDYEQLAKTDLFGLAGVMLTMMAASARRGVQSHGGPAWKAFAKALWSEAQRRGLVSE